jgi:hypothetical protein
VDWVTASALATAGGTLVLAVATFASVRSANRSARLTEQSLLAATRPLLMPTRPQDEAVKVGFMDEKWFRIEGGGAAAENGDSAVYLAVAVRNAGNGIAVLHGWRFYEERPTGDEPDHPPLESFTRLTRDLYISAGENGFWQGTFRDPTSEEYARARARIASGRDFTVDILYGDQFGGQRMVTRFTLRPRAEGAYYATVGRHWHVDGPTPR